MVRYTDTPTGSPPSSWAVHVTVLATLTSVRSEISSAAPSPCWTYVRHASRTSAKGERTKGMAQSRTHPAPSTVAPSRSARSRVVHEIHRAKRRKRQGNGLRAPGWSRYWLTRARSIAPPPAARRRALDPRRAASPGGAGSPRRSGLPAPPQSQRGGVPGALARWRPRAPGGRGRG